MGNYQAMSMSWDEYRYEEAMEALYAEHKEQAIEEFKDERLQAYYKDRPNVCEAPHRSLALARQLILQSPTASFIFAAVAVEVGIKEAILKPVVYGLVNSDFLAELIAGMVMSVKELHKLEDLLFKILNEYGGIDIKKYRRSGSSRTLWNEITDKKKGIRRKRNRIMHYAEEVTQRDAEEALSIASSVLDELFPTLIDKLGFHLHEGWRVCSDWRCKHQEFLDKLKSELGPD